MSSHNLHCPLCQSEASRLKWQSSANKQYWECDLCGLVWLDQTQLPSAKAEQAHYQTHQNVVTDPGYQNFVAPLVDWVREHWPASARGLDFGAGPGPVIKHLLQKNNYDISLYDPFFAADQTALSKQYDFITACEVVEHFHHPGREFKLLHGLLREGGELIIKTDPLELQDFAQWYYHRDPTHVCFYRPSTFEWIQKKINFRSLTRVDRRVFILKR